MASVTVRYGASDGYAAYIWVREPERHVLIWTGSGQQVEVRMLLPSDVQNVREVLLDGEAAAYELTRVFDSQYVVVKSAPASGTLSVAW
jgi:hypothetical protein